MHEYRLLLRHSPMAAASHEKFVQRKLTVQVLANFLDTLWVSRLSHVSVKTTRIAIEQVLATTQVLPCSSPHRRRNAFTTPLFYLHKTYAHSSSTSLLQCEVLNLKLSAISLQQSRQLEESGQLAY